VRRIALPALSDAAVRELAAGSGVDARSLLGATGGNPFLLVETIAAGGTLPASVRDAALARAGRLSLAAREVVDVAAVVGARSDPGLLRSLVGGECSDAVEEALTRALLLRARRAADRRGAAGPPCGARGSREAGGALRGGGGGAG
jgi:hypothetical protein